MTVPSLQAEQRVPGTEVLGAFSVDDVEVEIVENNAPGTEQNTDQFLVRAGGKAAGIIGLKPSGFGTYLGIAPLQTDETLQDASLPEVLEQSAEDILAIRGIVSAIVPPEARGIPMHAPRAGHGLGRMGMREVLAVQHSVNSGIAA